MSGRINLGPPSRGRRRIMQAKYDDTCSICLQDVLQGQDIEMTAEGAVHYGCSKKEVDGEE